MNLVITPSVPTDAKGKRKIWQEMLITSTTSPSTMKPKIVKDSFLQVVEYPTPTMESTKGKEVDTEKYILEHYSYLKVHASQERELTEERLRCTQPPQLINALDKKSQMMKIEVIQPPSIEDLQNKKINKFKLNMSQFNVVDKVDFFKQTSELFFSNLISTIMSKDKLFRDFKKLESKLKTEQVEKKALQIKRSEQENKIPEINKGVGNDAINSLIQEKDIEIQDLKKQLKLPHEVPVQTIEPIIVLQEKEVLQTELQNTKAIVGMINDQKNALEDQVKILKEKVDQLSIVDHSLYLASELGNLSIKELELRKVLEALQKEKHDILDKDKLLVERSTDKENLKTQIHAVKEALMDAKCLLWDHITREIKKIKDHLVMLQDENTMVTNCLSNVALVQESMGDNPIQAQRAINFLNSQSKTQLEFAGIQEMDDLIFQAKKYIVKDSLER